MHPFKVLMKQSKYVVWAGLFAVFAWRVNESLKRLRSNAIATLLSYEETSHKYMPSFTIYR